MKGGDTLNLDEAIRRSAMTGLIATQEITKEAKKPGRTHEQQTEDIRRVVQSQIAAGNLEKGSRVTVTVAGKKPIVVD